MVALLLISVIPAPAAAAEPGELPPLGMSMNAAQALKDAGAPARYGSFWVGPWMATSGWGGLDNALREGVRTGTTPVVFWYYWGDSISPNCIEYGCDGRSFNQWMSMTDTLVQHINKEMAGREVLIVIENEFNKGGVTSDSYAPTLDGYFVTVAEKLRGVPNMKLILGFGAWGESSWTKFPRSAAASDYIGFQMMRGSTRHSESEYRGASDRINYYTDFIAQKFNKPSFLYDLALSSYPDAKWEQMQAEELAEVFDAIALSGQTGLQGVLYRTLIDNPNMGLHNYFGYAERHWGLKKAYGAGDKPSWEVWKAKATGGAAPPPSPPPAPTPSANLSVPGAMEAELMTATAGGRTNDGAASAGAAWNLWSNGELRTTLTSEKAQTIQLSVTARGQSAGGIDAHMEIRLNGDMQAASFVAAGAYSTFVAEFAVPAGASTLAVAYTNDAVINGVDRNLIVDKVSVDAIRAANVPGAFEAEQMTATTGGQSNDGTASGGAAWNIWSNGELRQDLYTVDAFPADITVRARGQVAANVSPAMELHVNGALVATFSVAPGWADYRATTTLPAGDSIVSVKFTNDAVINGQDRNLIVDKVTVVQAAVNRAPTATFTVDGADMTFAFDASASSDADGDALTYAWNFGDGKTATGMHATNTYATAGSHTVTLTVNDGKLDATATANVDAVKPNGAPTASFTTSGADLTYAFDARGSSDPDADALTYAWNFGDGTSATGAQASHAYANAGTYTVALTVSDGKAEASASAPVTATKPNTAPTAAFASSGENRTFAFDARASSDADGDALSYAWNFGDGKTATGVQTSHAYASAGTYTVTLTVTDARGLSSTATRDVKATDPAPVPPPAPTGIVYEAENFATKDNGIRLTDAATSGGAYWFLWSTGGIHATFDGATGKYHVEVVAKGDEGAGWPIMELQADGVRIASWTVDSADWRAYAADVDFKAGQKLSLVFTNDYQAAGVDRNVRIDVLRATALVAPPAPEPRPVVSFEAESAQIQGKGAVFTDPAASGGKGYTLWSKGRIGQTVALTEGTYEVTIVAAGEYGGGGWPAMDLRVDGKSVKAFLVEGTTLRAYTATITVTAGNHDISAWYTNDVRRADGDRNLRVDVVTLTPK